MPRRAAAVFASRCQLARLHRSHLDLTTGSRPLLPKKPTLRRPCSLTGAGYAVACALIPGAGSSSPRRKPRGAERRQAPVAPCDRRDHPRLRGVARALRSARSPLGAPLRLLPPPRGAAWLGCGPRFLGRGACAPVPVQRAPRGRLVVAGGRSPAAARVRGYEPRPQAPHLAPPTSTSPEDAPRLSEVAAEYAA